MHIAIPVRFVVLVVLLAGCGDNAEPAPRVDRLGAIEAAQARYALCVCETLSDVGTLRIHGSLAVNGASVPRAPLGVDGSYLAYGGLSTVADLFVGVDLDTAGDARLGSSTQVNRDFLVGGSLSGDGDLIVGRTLRVAGQDTHLGHKDVGNLGEPAKSPPPACPCGLDVAEEVAIHSGETLDALPAGDTHLRSGEHFFFAPSTMAGRRLIVEGDATLYLAGAIDEIGPDQISLAPGATLDLWISDALDRLRPIPGVRVFLGGDQILLVSTGELVLYAPTVPVWYMTEANLTGALVVGTLHGLGPLELRATPP